MNPYSEIFFSEPIIFRDGGDMKPDLSLAYFEVVRKDIEGEVVCLEVFRGGPNKTYNTILYTDRNEQIWLSGFTCGKPHLGAHGLCMLIAMLDWTDWWPEEEVIHVVLNNDKFKVEFKGSGPMLKYDILVGGKSDAN